MPSEKQIEAYRKRLAKINAKTYPGAHLIAECLNAVVSYYDVDAQTELKGTLVGYTHRMEPSLLGGQRLVTDITLCTACVHQRGYSCSKDTEVTIEDALVTHIERNEEPS